MKKTLMGSPRQVSERESGTLKKALSYLKIAKMLFKQQGDVEAEQQTAKLISNIKASKNWGKWC